MSIERPGSVLPKTNEERKASRVNVDRAPVEPVVIPVEGDADADADPDGEAEAFVRFCYRRRAVAWPELYDEMCAVAARAEYRGMDYDQLRAVGIGFALAALPRLAEVAARVIAEEGSRHPVAAIA